MKMFRGALFIFAKNKTKQKTGGMNPNVLQWVNG